MKTIGVPEDIWKKLLILKAETESRSMSNVILFLYQHYENTNPKASSKILRNLLFVKRLFENVLSNHAGRKMFSFISSTWNPVTGCLHFCRYCWARKLATTKLKNSKRYADGFKPKIHEEEFKKRFKEFEIVFVSDMGDLFGEFIPDTWIKKVINHIRKFPKTYFLFLTKNPARYLDFIDIFPSNAILGATIETNLDVLYEKYHTSKAPKPTQRIQAMLKLSKKKEDLKLFISVEPILDFDSDSFVKKLVEIFPVMMYVGYDNYNNKLPEPPLKKTLEFISKLSDAGILVVKKTIRPAWNEKLEKFLEVERIEA